MRGKNNQLATVFYDRPEFVTRLSSDPQFVVMGIEQRNHSPILPSGVADVDLAADSGCASKSLADVACEKRVGDQFAVSRAGDHAVERNDSRRHEFDGRFNQLARRRVYLADRVFNASKRAKPVGGMR